MTTIKAYVRKVGNKVCYTFDDGRFFFCDERDATDDLALTPDANGQVDVDELYYVLAR